MTKRRSSNIPSQTVSELALIDFHWASQLSALCCHVTMWPSEQANQVTAKKYTAGGASAVKPCVSAAKTHKPQFPSGSLVFVYLCIRPCEVGSRCVWRFSFLSG